MKGLALIIIILSGVYGGSSIVYSAELEGLKFSIKPYIGFEESYYKTSGYDFYAGQNQRFVLYAVVENTNDYEVTLKSLNIHYTPLIENPQGRTVKIGNNIFLGKKGTDLAIEQFEIPGETFNYFSRSTGDINLLYSDPSNFITAKNSREVKFELSAEYKTEDSKLYSETYSSELGLFTVTMVPSSQLESYKIGGASEKLAKLVPLVGAIFSLIIGAIGLLGVSKTQGGAQKLSLATLIIGLC